MQTGPGKHARGVPHADSPPTAYTAAQMRTAINEAVEAKGLARPCVTGFFKDLWKEGPGLSLGQDRPYAPMSLVDYLTDLFSELDTDVYWELQLAVLWFISLKLGMRDQENRWLDWDELVAMRSGAWLYATAAVSQVHC